MCARGHGLANRFGESERCREVNRLESDKMDRSDKPSGCARRFGRAKGLGMAKRFRLANRLGLAKRIRLAKRLGLAKRGMLAKTLGLSERERL